MSRKTCVDSHFNGAGRPSTAPNPVFHWLNSAAAAADWGLPEAGPAAALLRLDASDWEPPAYCPVYDVLKSAKAGGPAPWHNNIKSSQDPLTGVMGLQRSTARSQQDPLIGLFNLQRSTTRSQQDPLIGLFNLRRSSTRSPQDPMTGLFNLRHSSARSLQDPLTGVFSMQVRC